jgi:hypothetical protein
LSVFCNSILFCLRVATAFYLSMCDNCLVCCQSASIPNYLFSICQQHIILSIRGKSILSCPHVAKAYYFISSVWEHQIIRKRNKNIILSVCGNRKLFCQ